MAAIAAMVVPSGGIAAIQSVPRPLLPELAEAAPSEVAVQAVRIGGGFDYRLDFASLAINLGRGPLIVEGHRRRAGDVMRARQMVLMTDGRSRAVGHDAGLLTYERGGSHDHWHLHDFEAYELRSLDGHLVRPVRKVGFCLGDRVSAGRSPAGAPRRPAWRSRCGYGHPGLLSVREGISVGYGDVYPPEVDGQYVELGGLPPGRYVLDNQVDPLHRLRVLSRRHDRGWTLIELGVSHDALGAPSLRVLRSCDGRFRACALPRA